MRNLLPLVLPLAMLMGGAAQADSMATVEARHAYFKSLGGAMKAMGPLTKSFDAEAAKVEVARLKAILATDTAPLFVAGTSDADFPGKSRAKAKIWSDMEGFGAKGRAMHEAGAAVIAAAEAEDGRAFAAAFGKLGGSCKDCHDTYRVPE